MIEGQSSVTDTLTYYNQPDILIEKNFKLKGTFLIIKKDRQFFSF